MARTPSRMEYSVELRRYFDEAERCADDTMPFSDVAPIAIYLYADIMYEKQARKSFQKFKNRCSHVRGVRGMSLDDIEELGWDGIYNEKFEDIVREYGYTTYVDQYGAYGWVDKLGSHFGDSSGFYPFYLYEETLRKNLAEGGGE